jgi:MFS family permease
MFTLFRQRNFALLWFGGLISLTGDTLLFVALPFSVYTLTGSTVATSTLVMVGILPSILVGSVAGVFVDRWDRKQTMIVVNILLALGLVPLLAVRSAQWVWVTYVVAFVESTLAQFFRPAEGALLPQLVKEENIAAANSLNALNNNVAWLIGPPLGGILVGLVGLSGVALLDAVSFLVSSVLIARITTKIGRSHKQSPPKNHIPVAPLTTIWHEWLHGLRVVKQTRQLVVIFFLRAVTVCGEGVFLVLFVPFVTEVLQGTAATIGWLQGAQAVGGLLGGVITGAVATKLAPTRLLGFSAITFGVIALLIYNATAFGGSTALVLGLVALIGVAGVGFLTSVTTLLQTSVSDEYRGRVFGAFGTTLAVFQLLGSAIAGVLGEYLGIVTVLNIQGGLYILAGVLGLVLLERRGSVSFFL